MMVFKIVADSSSDILTLKNIDYTAVPLKISTDEAEYVDDVRLDVQGMIADLQKYKGISRSSCPNADEWKQAFAGADCIFAVTITSGLSGSYNAACVAMQDHLNQHPEKKGYVIDSLSAGAEVALIVEKLQTLIEQELTFEEIVKQIQAYQQNTHLLFALESLRNLANNGRVSMAVAKFAGILGIRVIGRANSEGVLEMLSKVKGHKKALCDIVKQMQQRGYDGGRVRIHHCQNPEAAEALRTMLLGQFPNARISLAETRGLCSFYAESGGLLVGYESK